MKFIHKLLCRLGYHDWEWRSISTGIFYVSKVRWPDDCDSKKKCTWCNVYYDGETKIRDNFYINGRP